MEYVEKKVRVKKYCCKNCGINNSDEVLEVKLPCVTHKQWDSYNYVEKKSIIYEELKKLL